MASLIICEKPKVAEKVAAALSGNGAERRARDGISYFEFERNGKKIFVASAVGHLYTLKQETPGSSYPVFDIDWAPSWKVEKDAKHTKPYVELLEELGKKCDEFVNSCDYDVEGSIIGYNAIRFACNSLEGRRMKFSALTAEDLVEAYETMGPLDVNNAIAGETRHILDWFWGINLSRALMHAIRSAGIYKVLSIGRVQGPALSILALREHEIMHFKPAPYWQLFALSGDTRFLHVKDRFMRKEEAEAARKNSEEAKNCAKIEKVSRTEKRLPPNPPFDLTSLQVEAFKVFGFSPAHTLSMAQTLYESSLISYPRTSSQKLPAKLNLQKILQKLAANPAYSQKAGALLRAGRLKPFEGAKEDPAHPAIHPTGMQPSAGLGEREKKLYDLVAKRFIACFAEFAVREGMSVTIALGPEKYSVSGARTLSPGWIAYYSPYGKFEEEILPDFKEGAEIPVSAIEMPEKMTQPPKRYTEASIIQALEKKRLGTKATRSVVIETLHKRGYIEGRKSLGVTKFGLAVHGALARHCKEILDEALTRELEELTDQIAEGRGEEDDVIREGEGTLELILDKFKKSEPVIGKELAATFVEQRREEETLGKCVKCGNAIRILRNRATGKRFAACSGYPNCRETFPLPQMAKIIATGKACPSCGTPVILVRRKARRDFEMCLYTKCATKAGWGKSNAEKKQAESKPAAEKPAEGKTEAVQAQEPKPARAARKPASKPSAKKPGKAKPAAGSG
ncbi:MAG: DNA topoisomerase I [Candidatus ainarchaeum sp.]|nr:DNA topoisomerase I [Candidatus ainarchaeum sp.]